MENPQIVIADTPSGFEVRIVDEGINLVQRVFGPASEVEAEAFAMDLAHGAR